MARAIRKRKSGAQIEREVDEFLRTGAAATAVFYPGGRGGGGRRRGPGTAVVRPHARTSPSCTKCGQLHTTAEHRRHGKPASSKKSTRRVTATKNTKRRSSSTRPGEARSSRSAPGPRRAPIDVVGDAVASMPQSGRFGPDKVFISALWDRVGRKIGMDLPTFKRWLVEQNRDRHLDLARADLVGAMDRDLVRRSEIEDMGSTFNFVIDREAR